MNVRNRWMLAVLCVTLVTGSLRADSPPTEKSCPGSTVMALEDWIASGPCSPWMNGNLAKTAGSHAGKWLVAFAQPKSPSPLPHPTLAVDSQPKTHGKSPRVLLAQLEILRSDKAGHWKTICRPQIATVAGRAANLEFSQDSGKQIRVQLMMQIVKEVEASAPALLLAKMKIEQVDKDGKQTTLARPHILAMQDQDSEIAIVGEEGGLKIKLRMTGPQHRRFAANKTYPHPIKSLPLPRVVRAQSARKTALPRPLPAAPAAPAATDPNGRVLHARIEIEERDAEGKWSLLSRPQIVALEGRDATIEIGQVNGPSLKVGVNMRRVPQQPHSKHDTPEQAPSPLEAQIRIERIDSDGNVELNQTRVVANHNQKAHVIFEKANGLALKLNLQMHEVAHNPVQATATRKHYLEPTQSADPQPPVPLKQPTGLATSVQAPMELVSSEVDSRSATLARSPATRPATQPATRSLTPWISTAPAIAAPPLAPMPPRMDAASRPQRPMTLAGEDLYFVRKTLYEEHYQAKMTRLFAHIPNAQIAVDVRLHSAAIPTPEHVKVAITFPDDYIEKLWAAQRISDAPPTTEEMIALMDEVKANVSELAAAVLPVSGDDGSNVVIHAYTAVQSVQRHSQVARMQPVFATASPSSPFDLAPWMLGVIAITLLCASIGAAVLFRRAPAPPAPDVTSELLPRPPRRRAA